VTDARERSALAQGLAAVAGRMEPTEARQVARKAVHALMERRGEASDREEAHSLRLSCSLLIPYLDGPTVRLVAQRWVPEACSEEGPSDRFEGGSVSELLDRLLTDASPTLLRPRLTAVTSAVGLSMFESLSVLPALPAVDEPLPCRLATQELVELLKMPTCLGNARQVILRHLGNRYGRTFVNHWEFVRFARERGLDLDFTSPPKRPDRRLPALPLESDKP
jgi:hypothetical protein